METIKQGCGVILNKDILKKMTETPYGKLDEPKPFTLKQGEFFYVERVYDNTVDLLGRLNDYNLNVYNISIDDIDIVSFPKKSDHE